MEIGRSWVGGAYLPSSGERFASVDPATGETLALIESATPDTLDAALDSAQKGQKVWAAMPGAQRGRILRRAADLLREHNTALAELETRDTGKPIAETEAVDILSGADAVEYFGAVAATINGEAVDLGGEAFGYTRREPLGLTAGIGAWNYPIQIACWKSAPALACGNAMIFKPSELTPLSALKLAEIYKQAGVPDGVFTVLQGGRDVGQMLTQAPEIRKISLTGEVGTGRKVMAAAAGTLKYVTLELGGKSPLIVFGDADIKNAVSAALLANFYSVGEICSNGTRVFVHTSIRERFLAALKERVEKIRVGDPLDPQTQMGSLISQDHMQKVLAAIEAGKAEGATVLTGGTRMTDGALGKGAFVAPTVFVDCLDEMSIMRDEIFGPVMSVADFVDEEEVIARANATPFGLAAGVFTADLARAHRVIHQLQAGTCWINTYNITPVELPFGGYKQSGLGRENSRLAVEHYTQVKSVYVALGDVDAPY
ncbi:MAG: betaine-aldehyde dehydrogenase [Acetobacter sp.]